MSRQGLRKIFEIAASTTALVLGSAFPALAQAGRIIGRVLDQTGAVLPGVTIDLIVQRTELTSTPRACAVSRQAASMTSTSIPRSRALRGSAFK